MQLFGRPLLFPLMSLNPIWYLHSLAGGTSSRLPGNTTVTSVYWSFDSRSILLSDRNVFWSMDLNGGSPQRLPVVSAYTSWQPEGIITGGDRACGGFAPMAPACDGSRAVPAIPTRA